jgi:hypothetical protein
MKSYLRDTLRLPAKGLRPSALPLLHQPSRELVNVMLKSPDESGRRSIWGGAMGQLGTNIHSSGEPDPPLGVTDV